MAQTTLRSLAEEFNTRSAALPTSEHYKLFLELLDRVFQQAIPPHSSPRQYAFAS